MIVDEIALRLEACVKTLHKLPDTQHLDYMNYWPDIKYEREDLRHQAVEPLRFQVMPEEITRMEEALVWLTWVTQQERQLVWLRAAKMPWRHIGEKMGISKTSAQRRWRLAIKTISRQLTM